ncbi:MAG: c-type cytochrome [Deltaproteobacteria bacterium]
MKKYLAFFVALGIAVLVAYEALIYYDENFPFGRMWETQAVKPNEELPLSTPIGTVPRRGGEEIFKAMPEELLRSPFDLSDPAQIQSGKVLYSKFCAQCHGKNYDGNAAVGQSFHPLPTDLRSAKVQSLSEGAFFREISYGRPEGRQPPLAATIDPQDRWRIIAYVKSLGIRK